MEKNNGRKGRKKTKKDNQGYYNENETYIKEFRWLVLKLKNIFTSPISLVAEDLPRSESTMPSRKKYAKHVDRIIREYHGKDRDSFIFGLSGKWGAGKTRFLDELKEDLETSVDGRSFNVLTISPWKFGSEIETFLRNFLKDLNKRADIEKRKSMNGFQKVCFAWSQRNFLNSLDRDISKPNIEMNLKNILLIVIVLVWLLYKLLVAIRIVPWDFVTGLNSDQQLRVFVLAWYDLIAVLAIPLILYRFNISTLSKKVATLDQFDYFYAKILNKFTDKNLVVFVDDLDRVSPEVARSVLDSLRTFVDKPYVTFVVTGDHSVLERHIGSQITQSKFKPEQVEEGRRYLKKMFNLYWPLPTSTGQEFDDFIASEMSKKEEQIGHFLRASEDIQLLKRWLAEYFEKNLRGVIRFVETVIFNFGLVDEQLETAEQDLRIQLLDIKNNPILFIRLLMIQELAAPLHEEFTRNPSLLITIEEDLIDNRNQELSKTIDELKKKEVLSDQQERFLGKFMYEPRRFYDAKKGIIVNSIEPFIFLTSSSGFSDVKGPTTEDFMAFVLNHNIEGIIAALQSAGKPKLETYIKDLQGKLDSFKTVDFPAYIKTISTILESLFQIHEGSLLHEVFLNFFNLVDLDAIFSSSQSLEVRKDASLKFSRWLDKLKTKANLNHYYDKLGIKENANINQIEPYIEELGTFGNFSSTLVLKWIVYLYQFDQDRSLKLFQGIQDKILDTNSWKELLPLYESLAVEFTASPDTDKGFIIWELVKRLNDPDLNNLVGEKFAEQILAGRNNITNWIASNYSDLVSYIPQEKIVNAAIKLMKPHFNDEGNFTNLVTAHASLVFKFSDKFLIEFLALDDGELFTILKFISGNSVFAPLIPSKERADFIAGRMITYSGQLEVSGNAQGAAGVLAVLKKSQLWNSWSDTLPTSIKRRLSPKIRKNATTQVVKEEVLEVLKTWQ